MQIARLLKAVIAMENIKECILLNMEEENEDIKDNTAGENTFVGLRDLEISI